MRITAFGAKPADCWDIRLNEHVPFIPWPTASNLHSHNIERSSVCTTTNNLTSGVVCSTCCTAREQASAKGCLRSMKAAGSLFFMLMVPDVVYCESSAQIGERERSCTCEKLALLIRKLCVALCVPLCKDAVHDTLHYPQNFIGIGVGHQAAIQESLCL